MTTAPTTTETVYELIGVNLGPFATVWPYKVHTDVKVYVDLGQGPELLEEGPDYTLTPTNPPLTNGGQVVLDSTAIPSLSWPTNLQPGGDVGVDRPTVILVRDTPDGQPAAFGDMEGFSPQAWEQALDNVARQVQELDTKWGRTVHDAVGETGWDVPDELIRAGKYVGFDDFGRWALKDGTDGGGGGGGGTPSALPLAYPLHWEVLDNGLLADDQWLGGVDLLFNAHIPANFSGFQGQIFFAPDAPMIVLARLNSDGEDPTTGTPLGQIFIDVDGSLAATTTGAAAFDLDAGDRIDWYGPSTADTAGRGLTWGIIAYVAGDGTGAFADIVTHGDLQSAIAALPGVTDAVNAAVATAVATAVAAAVAAVPQVESGTIHEFAGPRGNVPAGYLICDGSAVSRMTYAALYARISVTWGAGNGSTTFNLPSLARRFLRGDDGSGHAVGELQEDALQGHAHQTTIHVGYGSAGVATLIAANSSAPNDFTSGDPVDDGANGTPRIDTETRPKSAAVVMIIKT